MSYEPFAEGWLEGRTRWGRPVDLEVLPDGSMLVSDDQAGVIYRISYSGKVKATGDRRSGADFVPKDLLIS